MQGLDLIGDVHGCGNTLRRLLKQLGYVHKNGFYQHPLGRKAVFVGDLLDRGPRVRQALADVHAMHLNGQAYMVLGNHEYNALAYFTNDTQGQPLRSHSLRHQQVIQETLTQFTAWPEQWHAYLDWFMTLPLALEMDSLRVVHACWDVELMADFLQLYPQGVMTSDFLQESVIPGSFAFKVVDRCTRGTWLRLPEGQTVTGKDGFIRDRFRTSFWIKNARIWDEVRFQPDLLPAILAERPLTEEDRQRLCYYPPEAKPLFFGHYWCEGLPQLQRPNLTCLDYSAVKAGRLVAYRFDGEKQLDQRKFTWVRVEPDEYPPVDDLRAEMTAEHFDRV